MCRRLEWMIDKASAVGLAFDPSVVTAYPTQPDARGTLHDSKRGLYRLTRPFVRSIGVADAPDGTPTGALDPTQELHASVRERWRDDSSYHPPGSQDYFDRGGK